MKKPPLITHPRHVTTRRHLIGFTEKKHLGLCTVPTAGVGAVHETQKPDPNFLDDAPGVVLQTAAGLRVEGRGSRHRTELAHVSARCSPH